MNYFIVTIGVILITIGFVRMRNYKNEYQHTPFQLKEVIYSKGTLYVFTDGVKEYEDKADRFTIRFLARDFSSIPSDYKAEAMGSVVLTHGETKGHVIIKY